VLPGVDLEQLIITVGLIGLFLIVFAESGLFFGFFLPGDSLLLTAGVISAVYPETFPIWLVCAVCFVAAVSGDAVGYTFGRRVGRRLYERLDSRFFKKSHLAAAEAYYEKHGGKTIVIARFLPFVRTFAPIVAGAAHMDYPRFALFNFTGAVIWAIGVPVAGYSLASVLPTEVMDQWLYVIIGLVIVLSVLPTAVHIYRHNREEVHARVRSRGRQGAIGRDALPDEPIEP
jgi:membrane-associated protein